MHRPSARCPATLLRSRPSRRLMCEWSRAVLVLRSEIGQCHRSTGGLLPSGRVLAGSNWRTLVVVEVEWKGGVSFDNLEKVLQRSTCRLWLCPLALHPRRYLAFVSFQ